MGQFGFPAIGGDFTGRREGDFHGGGGQAGRGVQKRLPLALEARQMPTAGIDRAPVHRAVDDLAAAPSDVIQNHAVF
jgi:hypothetical protein